MGANICVFSSSSCVIEKKYFDAADRLGAIIAKRGDTLLYGAGMTGLMGAMASTVKKCGGKVIGIIPENLNEAGIVYNCCDELIVTQDIRTRKAMMDEKADAFIAMPGGFGTLEELLEIITLKQLKMHVKPIIIMNLFGYYNRLLEHFETVIRELFAKPECNALFHVSDSPEKAFEYIDTYEPPAFRERWLTHTEGKPR